MNITEIASWPERIKRAIARSNSNNFNRVFVCSETTSTQDVARRMNVRAGDIITCGRQTAGLGRHGNNWADTNDDGLAVTFIQQSDLTPRLAVATVVGTSIAIEQVTKKSVSIKWPNDIFINCRKLAGILIEQADNLAYIGIGINVSQTDWPDDLADTAISLAQAGVEVKRIEMLESLFPGLSTAYQMQDEELQEQFNNRDILTGSIATFEFNNQEIRGRITSIDPFNEIIVESDGNTEHLNVNTARLIEYRIEQ